MDLDDEERRARFIQQQIKRTSFQSGTDEQQHDEEKRPSELKREDDDEKVTFKLPIGTPSAKKNTKQLPAPPAALLESTDKKKEGSVQSKQPATAKRKSALEEIREMEEAKRAKKAEYSRVNDVPKASSSSQPADAWLLPGIVVKVMTSKLGERYHKRKGVVVDIINQYGAQVRMLDTGDQVRLDQEHVETVIPAIGRTVRILHGRHRGRDATLESVDTNKFCCQIRLIDGADKGQIVDGIEYENISKLYTD
jgi:DNA/RNA-binding protein KIN17